MPGRFPLFADACINGHLIDALVKQGWDVVRAVDLHGERAKDSPLFEHAAVMERVFVTNDGPIERIAIDWLRKGRPFRMIFWSKPDEELWTIGQIVGGFEALAAREDDAFLYPLHYLKASVKFG